jgi:hypothetical protein
VGLASSFLALARNLGLVIGVAFAEMVMAFKGSALSLEGRGPSLEGIQDVWKLSVIIGMMAILLSWTRERGSPISKKDEKGS